MDAPPVRYEVKSGAAYLTIDREKARNALSSEVVRLLSRHIEQAEADAGVRVLVLTGAGERTFSAGGDLGGLSAENGFLGAHDARRAFGQLLQRLQNCPKPTLARVNGHSLAGGLGLLLACDVAVAVADAEVGTPELDVGLFPYMVSALLQRHVGRKRALELLLTGLRLKADVALQWGLVNQVVAKEALDEVVSSWVAKLSNRSLAVMTLGKRAFFAAEDLPLPAALEHLSSQLSLNVLLEDAAEGVTAFLEKRPPKWGDR